MGCGNERLSEVASIENGVGRSKKEGAMNIEKSFEVFCYKVAENWTGPTAEGPVSSEGSSYKVGVYSAC